MNYMREIRFVPFVVCLAAACGAGDGDPSLMHYGDEMTESIDGLQASLSAHHEAVLELTDLGRMRDVEMAHMGEMSMRMGRAHDARESLEQCAAHMSMGGRGDRLQPLQAAQHAMGQATADASAEMEAHMQAMLQARDIDAATAEEHRHRDEMNGLLDRMWMHDGDLAHAMQAMEDRGMSMMCPMGSHMHRRH
jgi:hypothetical protein